MADDALFLAVLVIIGTPEEPVVIPKGTYVAASDETFQHPAYKFKNVKGF